MSLKAGIVGLPNVGKSTLFNAITKQKILAANYPFATIEPNVGVVLVPDKRLDYLSELYQPKKTIYTTYEFTDIAGLVKGASSGEGLGNQFLSQIREVDAIVEVVRCFDDANIIHVEGSVDPVRDIETIGLELGLADMEVIENRLGRIGKKAQMTKDKETAKEVEALNKAKEALEKNIPLRKVDFTEDELIQLKNFNFLTIKPIIYMANVNDSDLISGDNEYVKALRKYADEEGSKVIPMCAKIEEELADLDDLEKEEFLKDLGIEDSGLNNLIKETYNILGLATFFTSGSDECRAWTFKKGMKAPQCAGTIHTDFERGFIKAEVISFEDLKNCGSELKVREAGKLRLEGKEYIMQDGDICLFRFNV